MNVLLGPRKIRLQRGHRLQKVRVEGDTAGIQLMREQPRKTHGARLVASRRHHGLATDSCLYGRVLKARKQRLAPPRLMRRPVIRQRGHNHRHIVIGTPPVCKLAQREAFKVAAVVDAEHLTCLLVVSPRRIKQHMLYFLRFIRPPTSRCALSTHQSEAPTAAGD